MTEAAAAGRVAACQSAQLGGARVQA